MSLRTNLVVVSGRLGRDPELKYSASGMPIVNLNLANSEARKKDDGTWDERTNWVNVVCFSGLAERVGEYMHKGSEVCIEGRLRYEEWEAEGGAKRNRLVVVASRVDYPSRPKNADDPGEQTQAETDSPPEDSKPKPSSSKKPSPRQDQGDSEEDDLPF